MGGGNPYLQIALFVGGQVIQARAAKGARDVRIAQAETAKRQLEQQRIEIEEQSKQDELDLRLEEETNKSKIRATYGAMGIEYSEYGSRGALKTHNEKMYDIDMGEILASKRNKLIENQYNIHGTALQKKAAREQYVGEMGRIVAQTGSEMMSWDKTPPETKPKNGGETQSGGGRGTEPTGSGGVKGSPGTQSGVDTRR
jgi:hypothetical protein